MAVDQVSARPVQALTAGGVQDASALREGTQIEGRVLAVNADESLRLATRYGLIDVDQSQIAGAGGGHGRAKMPPATELIGTMVKLEVTGQSSAGRLIVRLISSEDTGTASGAEREPPGAPLSEIQARVAAEVFQAAVRQDGLAPVFAGARQLSEIEAALSEEVQQALNDLTNHALDGATNISGSDIRNAVASSGLFLEAKLARLAAGGGGTDDTFRLAPDASLASQDLKAALFGLKSALDGWISETTASGAAAASTAGSGADEVSADEPPLPTILLADSPGIPDKTPAAFDTEALFAVLRPPPVVQPTGSQAQSAAAFNAGAGGIVAQLAGLSGRPDLVTMAALGEWFQASGQTQAGSGGRRNAYGRKQIPSDMAERTPRATDTVASARPPPPRRGSLPQGQAALAPAIGSQKQPIDIARDLALKTGNALARISLGQYASLPEQSPAVASGPAKSPAATQSSNPASWLFEIPIRIAGLTSIAQFEIDQVLDGGSGVAEDGRAWRVQFSLDVTPMGPVHVRLVLAGQRLSVGLWAEDRIGTAALQRGILSLRQSLESAHFIIDEIHFAPGRPPSGPPVRAGGFIDRNA